MKARMPIKRLTHSEACKVEQVYLETAVTSIVAAVLYILYRRGWHKDKLVTLYKEIINFFAYPQAFDKYLTDDEVKDFLTDKLGINWKDLETVVKVVK